MLATVLKRISTVYFNPLMDHEVNLVDHGSIKKKKKNRIKKISDCVIQSKSIIS